MDPQQVYIEEARELLAELETVLLELEANPTDQELIAKAFRALHTIKGSGAMFGFDEIASFTHEVETVFDLVRDQKLPVTKELIDLTLLARDRIRGLLEGEENEIDKAQAEAILKGYKDIVNRDQAPEEKKPPFEKSESDSFPSSTEQSVTYRIRFRPARDLFASGNNPVPLLNELRSLGPCTIVANTGPIPLLAEVEPESCYVYWDIILTTNAGLDAIRDVFIFVEDASEIKVEVIDEEGLFIDDSKYKKLGEILIERGDIDPEELKKVLSSQKKIGELLVEAGLVQPENIQSALLEQEHIRKVKAKRQKVESVSSIRVDASKLDLLVNLVGELVTVQARLSQTASSSRDSDLVLISEEIERLTEELRDNALGIRMLPIGSTFSQFQRLVRDLAGDQQKEIAMTTEGEETELDKTVIDRLHDPLVHLIRNSIDHGIELPETRRKANKPVQGRLHLSALHSGAHVLIRIEDDGKGLDPELIRSKAVEKGLISADAKLSEKEIFSLIFAAGFSTAATVTNVSGRGVGMDVVKRTIDSLRGTIEIESQKGIGTTVTLKLPLTLAIIDGLLVETGGDFYVMPLSSVEECVELTREDIKQAHGRHIANVRGEIVPYLRLREQFVVQGALPEIEQIVITGVNGHRTGIVVDQVVGQHQTVIKSLGKFYKEVELVSGATILGDGTLALILDLPKLTEKAERQDQGGV
jgi:two-component system, chemotaxis family, sensor kinase CheA